MAWRAGAWPDPPWMTCPMMASSTEDGSIPARRTASRITRAPSWGAVNDERPPRYLPIGVRTADRMTGVVLSVMRSPSYLNSPQRRREHRGEFGGSQFVSLTGARYQPHDPRGRSWTFARSSIGPAAKRVDGARPAGP